jgi:hypothetical protein
MSDLTDITAVFATASAAFEPIARKPNDADLQRLNEVLVVCCLSVSLTGTDAGCPSGVVLTDTVYKLTHTASFDFMRDARAEYDDAIAELKDDATRVAKTRVMEHRWTAGTRNQRRIRAIEVGARKLVLDNVDETWYKTLCAAGTFYTGVTVRALLDHLELDGTGLDRPAGVEIFLSLHLTWDADPRVSQFIIAMEEAQKKSVRAKLPITADVLAAFATSMLLRADSFPRNRPTWDGKKVEDQTWPAWKDFFRPLQLALEREQAVSADQPDTFGTAASAQRFHGIDPTSSHGTDAPGQPGSPDDLMAQLDSHFDNLASAATNSNSALEQLALATTDQYAEIKSSLDALAAAAPAAAAPTTRRRPPRSAGAPLDSNEKRKLERRIRTLEAAIKNKWSVGGFCSTHGHGVSAGHDSKTCGTKGTGHVDSATRQIPAGPGKDKNKGWDTWIP